MAKISVCMIVKDEEHILSRCLTSIRAIADEIVIVDTGSSDNTVSIAKQFTKNIFHFDWVDDFSAARNFALSKCNHEYICTWDADWILRAGDEEKILKLKKNLSSYDRVYFSWNVEFDEDLSPLRQSQYHFLFKRSEFHWESPIHNELVPNAPQKKLRDGYFPDIEVYHFKDPQQKQQRYEQTERILEEQLQNDPENTRLRIFLAQGYQFKKEYQKAIDEFHECLKNDQIDDMMRVNIYERVGMCYLHLHKPRKGINILTHSPYKNHYKIKLLVADLYLGMNPIKAYQLYKEYIDMDHQKESEDFDYYPERYEVYPLLMLGNLSKISFRKKKSQEYYRQALEKTRSKKTRLKLEKLISA